MCVDAGLPRRLDQHLSHFPLRTLPRSTLFPIRFRGSAPGMHAPVTALRKYKAQSVSRRYHPRSDRLLRGHDYIDLHDRTAYLIWLLGQPFRPNWTPAGYARVHGGDHDLPGGLRLVQVFLIHVQVWSVVTPILLNQVNA